MIAKSTAPKPRVVGDRRKDMRGACAASSRWMLTKTAFQAPSGHELPASLTVDGSSVSAIAHGCPYRWGSASKALAHPIEQK